MRNVGLIKLFLSSLLLVWAGCKPIDPVIRAVALRPLPPDPTPELIRVDPASFIEGVYVGSSYASEIELEGGVMLIKRLDPQHVQLFSVYGLMVPYTLALLANKDTVVALPNQRYRLSAVVKNLRVTNLQVSSNVNGAGSGQPDLAYFSQNSTVASRSLALYRSVATAEPSLYFLTGIYSGQLPVKVNAPQVIIQRAAVVVRQVSSSELELSDVFRWQTPIRLSVRKSTADSTWLAENDQVRATFTVAKGQPQRFVIQPKILSDTTDLSGWPPLHYEYNSLKTAQKHAFIAL